MTAAIPVSLTVLSQPMLRDNGGLREQTEEEKKYTKWMQSLQRKYLDYPWTVGIETLARCNASCNFCPYPTMERKGDRMSDELIAKVLRDLRDIPADLPLRINLTRVNEPFLDKRIIGVMQEINKTLPHATLALFTNGSVLTEKLLDELETIKRMEVFNVSFNSHEPVEYTRVMGLPFERTVRNIDLLHERMERGTLPFSVSLSRVGDGSSADAEFGQYTKGRWPKMTSVVSQRMDWIGKVDVTQTGDVPVLGCVQWFSLHMLASGKDSFCCIDHDAAHGFSNVADQHVLELYNHPTRRKLRESLVMRQQFGLCSGCVAWG